jgi:hypothetical protein
MRVSKTNNDRKPLANNASGNFRFFAPIGLLLLCVELYTWGKWIGGAHFVTTHPVEAMTDTQMNVLLAYQVVAPILMLFAIWYWIVKPWRQNGNLTTDGMLAISMTMIVFFDPTYNYASTSLLYNSHLWNFGAWTSSMPGWMSPRGHLLPEPLLVAIPGYLVAVFGQAVLVLWVLRKYLAKRPSTSVFTIVLLIVGSLFVFDTFAEIILIRSRVYVYPGAIHALALWPGQWYQFPLTESLFFGGFGIGVTALLMHFKDDRGETFADRGLEKLGYSSGKKQILKFLSLFGCAHLGFLMLYTVPSAFVALHSDEYPNNIPQYFINDMCAYGIDGKQCPGPGVMMPRPTKQFFEPDFDERH